MSGYQVRVLSYNNLIETNARNLVWNGTSLPAGKQAVVSDVLAGALQMEGLRGNQVLWDVANAALKDVVWELIGRWFENAYLVHVDPQPKTRSRVRSYKGLFWNHPTIEQEDVVQRELSVGEDLSSFFSVLKVNEKNWHDVCDRSYVPSFNSVLLLSRWDDTMEVVSKALSFVESTVDLERPRIIHTSSVPFFVEPGTAVAAFTVDAADDDFINFHVFFHKEDQVLLPTLIRRLLPDFIWDSP